MFNENMYSIPIILDAPRKTTSSENLYILLILQNILLYFKSMVEIQTFAIVAIQSAYPATGFHYAACKCVIYDWVNFKIVCQPE